MAPRSVTGVEFLFHYTGIRVRNLERSVKFYTEAIGLKEASRGTMAHGGVYVLLKDVKTGQLLELNWYPKGSRFFAVYRKGEELDHLAFYVKDVEAAYKELLKKGATVAVSPADSEGTEVYVKDPDGIWLELLRGKD
jgi:lactoylglutathione lyase